MAKRLCTNDVLEMLELEDDGEEIFCEGSDEEFGYDEELENDRSESDNKHGDEDDTVLEKFVIDNYMVNDVDDDYNMEDSNRDCIMKNVNEGSEIGGDRATDSDERNEVDNEMENESDSGYEHNMECNEDTQTRGKKGKKAVRINNN